MESRFLFPSLLLVLFLTRAVKSVNLPLPSSVVYQFPTKPTWVENIAVRPNGQLLVTLLSVPEVWLINPASPATATLVHTFSLPALGVMGITEMEPDVWYVAAGNISLKTVSVQKGSWSVYKVDMRSYSKTSSAIVTNVTTIAGAVFLNGMSTLSRGRNCKTVLIADSVLGGFWKLNVDTKASSFAISDPSMVGDGADKIPVGADGNKVNGGYLYYTSSDIGFLGRITISQDGLATGAAQLLTQSFKGLDDILVDRCGSVWFCQNYRNVVSVLYTNGTVVDAVGALDQITIGGPTACAFGRSGDAVNKLYCTTNGGIFVPVNGTVTEPGKIVVVNIENFYNHE
jgi:hypothetical protein